MLPFPMLRPQARFVHAFHLGALSPFTSTAPLLQSPARSSRHLRGMPDRRFSSQSKCSLAVGGELSTVSSSSRNNQTLVSSILPIRYGQLPSREGVPPQPSTPCTNPARPCRCLPAVAGNSNPLIRLRSVSITHRGGGRTNQFFKFHFKSPTAPARTATLATPLLSCAYFTVLCTPGVGGLVSPW